MMLPLLALLSAPFVSEVHAQDAAKTYDLRGSLYIQVYKDPTTVAQSLAHDHVIQAAGWTGTVTWDPNNLASCKVSMSLPVASLVVDEKNMRTQLGYTTFPSDSEREDIKKAMLGSDQLDGAKFPTITYQSTSCTAVGEAVDVAGNLTIHGVTKPVTMHMAVKADAVNFSAKGSTAIRATQYGFQPFSAGFGALKNQDRMLLVVDVNGTPK